MSNTDRASPQGVTGIAAWLAVLAAVGALLPATALPQAAQSPAAGRDNVDEIIVTARKVEERLQDVPMSVQVLSGDLLDTIDTTRLYELQFNVPGLVVNNAGMFGAGFSLRGIATQGGTGDSVAAHLNGVYLGSANLALTRMFDLERIEVLKGPQGTLYGRNSTGGTLNFITRAPQDELSVELEAAYGSFDTARVQGHVNLPFQRAAVRLAFTASEGDGYIRNSIDDRRFGEEDFRGLRASLRVTPSDVLRLDLMAQHVRDDGANGELWGPRPDFLVDPADIRLTTVTLENPYLIMESEQVGLNLEYDLGIAMLRSISGYARSEVRNLDDCAGLPLLQGCVRGARPNRRDQWSQELQLVFQGTDRLDGLIGAQYFEADGFARFHQTLPMLNPDPLNDYRSTSRETTQAVFGQANLHLAEQWSVTGGLRLSREQHRASTIGTGVQDSPTLLASERDSDNVSWRLDLRYSASDDLLAFAGVSTGFKSGGLTITNGELDTFDPENLTAYEAGMKSRWLDRKLTLNASAFYYDFEDLQVHTVILQEDRLDTGIANAARAKVYGIDADGVFRAWDRWSFSAGVVWLPRREFVRFRHDTTGDTISGNKLVRAPEWTATAAIGHEHPLRHFGTLSARIEYSFRSAFFFTIDNLSNHAQDRFGLLNAFLRFDATSGKWYVFASGRNLANQDYYHVVFLQSSPGYPDTYEVGAGYRF
jgi:iron complex outermembrane receptor protein